MQLTSIELQIRVGGAVTFVFIGYSLCMGSLKLNDLPPTYSNPVLALELVNSGDDIDIINRAGKGEAHTFISEQLRRDTGFIVLYVLFFSAISLILRQLISGPLRWLTILSVACAIAAGVFDLVENRGMVKALATPQGGGTDQLAASIRNPSLAKWALIYVFCIITGSLFLSGRKLFTLHSLSFGWLLLLAGIVGITGVVLNFIAPRFYPTFPIATFLMLIATVWLAIVFDFTPGKVVNSLSTGR